MKTLTSKVQIEQLQEQLIRQLLKNVSEEVLKWFKVYVDEYVYENHGENKVYHNPEGREFREAWDWTEIRKEINKFSTEMFLDWERMSNHPGYFGKYGIHGSQIDGWDPDARQYMDAILDKTVSSRARISVYRPQTYWKMFKLEMFDSGWIKKIFDKHAKKLGLNIVK